MEHCHSWAAIVLLVYFGFAFLLTLIRYGSEKDGSEKEEVRSCVGVILTLILYPLFFWLMYKAGLFFIAFGIG